jgi:hypothetical protein
MFNSIKKSILIFLSVYSVLLCCPKESGINRYKEISQIVYISQLPFTPVSSQRPHQQSILPKLPYHHAQRINVPLNAVLTINSIIIQIRYLLILQELPINKFRRSVFLKYRPRGPTLV